jgi:hypothetical protein
MVMVKLNRNMFPSGSFFDNGLFFYGLSCVATIKHFLRRTLVQLYQYCAFVSLQLM